jgi:hypothetical protein
MTKRTITLYKFRELGPVEQKKALDAERIYQRGYIQEMIEALFEMYQVTIDGLEIDFDKQTVEVLGLIPPTAEAKQKLQEVAEIAREELPILMGDEYMTAHIEADDGWYLKSGDLWVYGEAA